MNYVAVVQEAWTLVRRNRALPALSLIQAAYSIVLMLAILAAIVPLTLSLSLTAAENSAGEAETLAVLGFLQQHSTAFMVLVIALTVCALAIAVVDVAAQAGLIDQAVAAAYGNKASFATGLSRGMARWWRTAGLLAIPALPALLYLLLYAVVMYTSFVAPALAGADLDAARMSATSSVLAMVSSLISLVTIPLAIFAGLGLRFAVADDRSWPESLRHSWALIRSRFVDIVLSYLVLLALTIVAVLVLEFVIALLAAALIAIVVLLATSGATAAATAVGVIGVLIALLAFALMAGLVGAVVSSFWTVLWLRLTRQPQVAFPSAPPYPEGTAPPGLAVPASDWSEQ